MQHESGFVPLIVLNCCCHCTLTDLLTGFICRSPRDYHRPSQQFTCKKEPINYGPSAPEVVRWDFRVDPEKDPKKISNKQQVFRSTSLPELYSVTHCFLCLSPRKTGDVVFFGSYKMWFFSFRFYTNVLEASFFPLSECFLPLVSDIFLRILDLYLQQWEIISPTVFRWGKQNELTVIYKKTRAKVCKQHSLCVWAHPVF